MKLKPKTPAKANETRGRKKKVVVDVWRGVSDFHFIAFEYVHSMMYLILYFYNMMPQPLHSTYAFRLNTTLSNAIIWIVLTLLCSHFKVHLSPNSILTCIVPFPPLFPIQQDTVHHQDDDVVIAKRTGASKVITEDGPEEAAEVGSFCASFFWGNLNYL